MVLNAADLGGKSIGRVEGESRRARKKAICVTVGSSMFQHFGEITSEIRKNSIRTNQKSE